MLGEQIKLQSSESDQSKILVSVCITESTSIQSSFQVVRNVDNCLEGIRKDCQIKQLYTHPDTVKNDFQRLSALYEKEKNSLIEMEEEYSIEQKRKLQMINKLHASLNQIYQNQSFRDRKGSQISTAGEDEQMRTYYGSEKQKIIEYSYKTIMMLQRKLQNLKNGNFRKNQKQNQRIAQLKILLSGTEVLQCYCKDNLQKQESIQQGKQDLHLKIMDLGNKRQQLMTKKASIESKILIQKTKLQQLENKTEYILSTRNCCQQILDQQLKIISYKFSSRRSEYDAAKKYLDKVVKQKKYQENVSFKQTQNQIAYLNNYCDEMIYKKNHILHPDIKKYKLKRRAIVQQISQNHQLIKELQTKKYELSRNLHQKDSFFIQLQDQYCLLIEKAENSQNPQRRVMFLKEKRQKLAQELQQIIIRIQEAQQEIDTNQNLVPQNIIKDLEKRIKKKNIEFQKYENILREGIQLQNQNRLLQEQKDRGQQKTNPELQELMEEENLLVQSQNIIKDAIKSLREKNKVIEIKISKFQESIKTKAKMQENNRSKKPLQKLKKDKDHYENTQIQMRNSKVKGHSYLKQTAIEKLTKQFPINSSQETFDNSSLLVSNPASWMLVIFVVLVIPGLCIGYNF